MSNFEVNFSFNSEKNSRKKFFLGEMKLFKKLIFLFLIYQNFKTLFLALSKGKSLQMNKLAPENKNSSQKSQWTVVLLSPKLNLFFSTDLNSFFF